MAWIAAIAAASTVSTSGCKKRPLTKADKYISLFGLGAMLGGLIIFMWAILGSSSMFSPAGVIMWIVMFTLGITMLTIACLPVQPGSRGASERSHHSRSSSQIYHSSNRHPAGRNARAEFYYKNSSSVEYSKQFCKNCGLKLEQEDRYCYSCGSRIN